MVAAKQLIQFPKFSKFELGFDDAIVTIGDGSINVDGTMVKGSRSFRRDPRLGNLVDDRYRPPSRRGGSRAEITHLPMIPKDEQGRLMRFCSGGHYASIGEFGKRTRNLYHGDKLGLDDTCAQCRKLQRNRHRTSMAA